MVRKSLLFFLGVTLTVLFSNVFAQDTLNTEKKGPVAVITNASFTSAPVIEGNDITHEFVIKNSGTETLKISRVKTG